MKQFLEFAPIVLFFIVYQLSGKTIDLGFWQHEFNGLFSATAVMMIATTVQAIILLSVYKKLEKRELLTIIAVLALGTLTLVFHNGIFIIWKPTIFNWILAVVFAAAPFFIKTTLVEKAFGSTMQLPAIIWQRLNYFFIFHFTLVGAANIYVAYSYEEATWVSYKLFSSIGFTVFMLVATIIIVAPYLKSTEGKH